jgi:hypothetical protein
MAEGLDTGIVKIDRIQHKVFESATRTIFSCNPRPPKNSPDQRRMGDLMHGCEALKGLFPDMMIRRVDFCMFATSGDIENKGVVFNPSEDPGPPQVSAEDLRALIFWAWNLKESQVIIPPEVAREIRRVALELSNEFGCDNPPIVYPEDFRKTMARLCVAYAVLDLSANEDFTQVIVTQDHVREVSDFLAALYWAENCRLDRYAKEHRKRTQLEDGAQIIGEFIKLVGDSKRRYRILYILRTLINNENVRQIDLKDELGVSRMTVNRDCQVFLRHRLATSSTRAGYAKTPKLVRLIHRLEKNNPDFYDLLLNSELSENLDEGEN